MGGKPSKGTPKDMRLKRNRKAGKKSLKRTLRRKYGGK